MSGNKTLWVLAVCALLSTGCEGYRCATGSIRDAATGSPLDSVYCDVVAHNDDFGIYTDSNGFFDVCNDFGGCVPRCKDIRVEFSKLGYQTVSIENPDDSVFIALTR